ncbi:hypothetical protein PJ267_14630 [Arthrobacter sp. OVS8]|nr:hypothetical protein PJ267_14630 [Arthrobacter sp. OVS8]
MVFGYIVVLALLPLVRVFGRLPDSVNRGFAWLLNAGTVPFDIINYWGSREAHESSTTGGWPPSCAG